MKSQKKPVKKDRGMTLVGVLIGIAILSIALSAQIRLLGNTIKRESELRSMIIATNLAREGIEIAFSWRVNWGWGKLVANFKGPELCADAVNLDPKLSASCQTLNYVDQSGFKAFVYQIRPVEYAFAAPSFRRVIKIESCNGDATKDDECLELVSQVGWDDSDPDKKVEIKKKIYNWYVP